MEVHLLLDQRGTPLHLLQINSTSKLNNPYLVYQTVPLKPLLCQKIMCIDVLLPAQ